MTENQKEAFRKKVKYLMIDTGVKQRDILEEVNKIRSEIQKKAISEQFISKIINGDKDPTFEVLTAMSRKFGCTIDELTRGEV